MASKIAVTFDISEPRSETVEHDVIKIGSLSSCHLRLEGSGVSRIHAVIEVASPTEMTIIDLGSDNGTFVNGERVNKSPLKLGDRIGIGSVTLVVTSTEPILKEPSGYRDSPVVRQETFAPEIRALAKPSPWTLAKRWWPAPASAALAIAYFAQHGPTLPPTWDLEGLELDWPIPQLLLLLALVATLFAVGDALLRRSDGARTPLGRLFLVLAGAAALPWILQLGFGAITLGSYVIGIVAGGCMVIFGVYKLGRWIMRGRE